MTTTTLTTTVPISLIRDTPARHRTSTTAVSHRGPASVGVAAAALPLWIATTLLVLTGGWRHPVPSAVAGSGSAAGSHGMVHHTK